MEFFGGSFHAGLQGSVIFFVAVVGPLLFRRFSRKAKINKVPLYCIGLECFLKKTSL
jgi:hypothetical protein